MNRGWGHVCCVNATQRAQSGSKVVKESQRGSRRAQSESLCRVKFLVGGIAKAQWYC